MEEKFICECGKEFKSKNSLRTHYRFCKVHKRKPKGKVSAYKIADNLYRCECGKEFNNSQSLNAHFSHCRVHKGKTGKENEPINHRGGGGFILYTKEQRAEMTKRSSETLKNNIKLGKVIPVWTGKKLPKEMKEKIRKGRVKFLKENPGQHGAWNKANKTYLEKWFENFILENNLNTKYNIEFNYSLYPYFLDFAFIDLKLDVEVDGSFHYVYDANIEHDKIRNEILEKQGWKVFRISIDEVNKTPDKVKEEFLAYLNEFNENSISRYYN